MGHLDSLQWNYIHFVGFFQLANLRCVAGIDTYDSFNEVIIDHLALDYDYEAVILVWLGSSVFKVEHLNQTISEQRVASSE